MKKRFTILIAAIAAILMLAQPKMVVGQSRTDVTGTMNFVSNPAPSSPVTSNNVQFTWSSANIAVATSGTSTGFKANSNMTVTIPSGATLKTISITKGSNWGNAATITVYTGSNNQGTLIATFTKDGSTSASISSNNTGTTYYFCNSTSKNAWITALSITYTTGGGQQQTVATPQISLATDTYYGTQFVTISCGTTDANIYYTMGTNPSTPTSSSTPYTGAIQVTETTTIKAIAIKEGMQNSGVATSTLTIQPAGFDQDWEGTMDGWKFVSVSGNQTWAVSSYNNNKFAKITGYANNTNNANEDWIISPAFNLGNYTNPVLTFTSARNNQSGSALEVYFSNDYAGGTNANPTWTQLTCSLPAQPESGYTDFTSSGDISLSSYSGANCYIGFKYTSTTSAAVTWEVDDIELFSAQPTITVTPNSLSGFTYVEGHGPSTAQTVSVSGSNLTVNISLSLDENSKFEMCLTQNGTYSNSLTLTQSEGTVSATNIYVRLKEGLGKAANYSGTITLTSTDATDKTVSLSGSVTGQTYAIEQYSSPATAHGTISFSPESPIEAETEVTLTAEPAEGYDFTADSWVFYKESGNDIVEDNSITVTNGKITMPAYDLWVDATFDPKQTYAITCPAVTGGVLQTTPSAAYEGQTVTLEYTIVAGYSLSSIVITHTDGGAVTGITPTAGSGNTFTFTMPGYAVTATANFISNTFEGSFVQYSGDLTEGDYILVYSNQAMNDTLNNNRYKVTGVSAVENVISNPSRAIVWHIAPSKTNGYWTICSVATNKYVSGTSSSNANVGAANDTTTNSANTNWKVSGTYDFRCKANESQSARYLRYYASNDVFGNYASNNGGALTLYKLIPPTAPVWSALPTPNIYTGNVYELTLTDYVTGNPAPNITLSTEVSSTLYEYEDGHFTFQTNTAGTYEFTFTATNSQGSVSATLTITVAAPEEYDLTVTLDDHVTGIFVFNAANQNNPLIANGAAGTVQVLEGTSIMVSPDVAEGYALESLIVNNTDVTSQIDESSAYTFTVTGDVTITASAVFNPYVTLTGEQMANMTNHGTGYGTGASYLKYITIDGYYWEANAYQQSSTSQYLQINTTGSGNPKGSYIKLPVFNGKIEEITCTTNSSDKVLYFNTTNSASNPIATEDNSSTSTERTIDLTDVFYQTGYIVSSGSIQITNITVRFSPYQDMTGNTLETIGDDATVSIPANANVTATNLEIPESSGIVIKSGATLTVSGTLSNDGNANNIVIEDGGQLITHNAVQATVEKNITGAGESNWGEPNPENPYTPTGWYFIASPVDDASFSTATVDDYDLYMLDWANKYWRNIRNTTNNSLFANGFELGTGYLYASKDGNTVSVAGEIKPLTAADTAQVVLKTNGWNLIGNPLTCKVMVDKAFSELTNASAVTNQVVGSAINPCQGIAVYGEAGDVVTFTKAESQNAAAPSNNSSLQMTLAKNVATRGNDNAVTVDNAVVSFNEGSVLPKFSMLEGNAKLYIPQGNEEYAIVSTNAQGEMPVNFVANEEGAYTITVNPENVEMNYLHLKDNITGTDVDLLTNPSYTFTANADDYPSRFRLVFIANDVNQNDNENESFAFIGSDGQLIVNGIGTVQIIDLTGRVISTKSTEERISTNGLTPGVYVLRLIGEKVKTQKIVVR